MAVAEVDIALLIEGDAAQTQLRKYQSNVLFGTVCCGDRRRCRRAAVSGIPSDTVSRNYRQDAIGSDTHYQVFQRIGKIDVPGAVGGHSVDVTNGYGRSDLAITIEAGIDSRDGRNNILSSQWMEKQNEESAGAYPIP